MVFPSLSTSTNPLSKKNSGMVAVPTRFTCIHHAVYVRTSGLERSVESHVRQLTSHTLVHLEACAVTALCRETLAANPVTCR
jgi:hypothetical protein